MKYSIPLFDLNYGEDEIAAVERTIRSGWISMGPRTEEFEDKFARMFGAPSAVAVSSGTAALHLALRILGIREGDEVIVPSLTFVATVNCVRYVNAIPVFCDIKGLDDLTLDPEQLEKLITRATKAVIVMHYGGFPCDMDAIMDVARTHGLYVVEDTAHAPLSEYKGKRLGTIGDVGCFSFFSNKNISTGEGGMLLAQSEEHCKRARLLRGHGMTTLSYERSRGHATAYDVVDLGYNYRLDDIRASLGIVQLEKLKEDRRRRAEIRDWYLAKLSGLPSIVVPFADQIGAVSNYIFPVVLRQGVPTSRDEVRRKLAETGIETSVHYPAAHRFSIFNWLRSKLSKTEYVSDNLISLPMFATLQKSQVDQVANELSEIVKLS